MKTLTDTILAAAKTDSALRETLNELGRAAAAVVAREKATAGQPKISYAEFMRRRGTPID